MGRDEELTDLHDLLQGDTTVAICAVAGMGGVGKTELAFQYALKHRDLGTYPGGVCWLEARQDLGLQIVDFARIHLGYEPPTEAELPQKVKLCWANWRDGATLIVLDDVQQYDEAIRAVLPPARSRFKVLLTTREQLRDDGIRLLPLEKLRPLAAFELLYKTVQQDKTLEQERRITDDQPTAEALCEWLGCLPLGIKLTAAFLRLEPTLSLAGLLEQLKAEKLKHDGLTAIEAVFELSWEKLTDAEQQLAGLLGVFGVAPVQWNWVEAVVERCQVKPSAPGLLQRLGLKRQREPQQWCELVQPKALERGRRRLVELSLVERVADAVELHPLVREFFGAKLKPMEFADDLKRAVCAVLVAVARQIPPTPTLTDLAQAAPAIPHLKEAATTLEPWLTDADLIKPATRLGWFYEGQSAFADAEAWKQHCLKLAEARFGANHPSVATSLNNLALVYESQGRYSEAEPLHLQALSIRQQQLGNDHPDVAQSLNNLALVYRSQGRYSEAEPLFLQALSIVQQQLGNDHPHVAASLNNLALVYESQGRYSEAEPLFLQALSICQQQLGDDHPDVAQSLNNLAGLHESQGRYSEAQPLYLQALSIRQQQLGNDHPDVATSLNNLAVLYESQGRYSEAEPLHLQALSIRQQQLGNDHPDVATSLNNLAGLHESQGRYREAEQVYLKALAILFEKLGADHPSTQTVWRNFLYLLQQAIQSDRTVELSVHPTTQSLLQQLQADSLT